MSQSADKSMIPVTRKLTLLPYLVHGAHLPAFLLVFVYIITTHWASIMQFFWHKERHFFHPGISAYLHFSY